MKTGQIILLALLVPGIVSCSAFNPTQTALPSPTLISTTPVILPTETFSPTSTLTFTPLPTETLTPRLLVQSLEATVTADRLSCRYGPGPEYLYLFAFRAGATIKLIGRVDGDNWNWALVENQVPCWVNASYLNVAGEVLNLPAVYPDEIHLPRTPYYPPSAVLNAERNRDTNQVTISWLNVPVSLGDYEDDSMQTYIVELWRCEGGQLVFDPVGTRLTVLTFVDEPGCAKASHGRVFVQEKHGYAGPAEIPWPAD